MSRYTMGNGFLKWNYLLLGVIAQMFIFQMQDSVTLRKARQSLFNRTLPCGFHGSNMCGKVYTFVCIHLQHKVLPNYHHGQYVD
jgi:hypothetical protein